MRNQLVFCILIVLISSSGCKKSMSLKPDLKETLQGIINKNLAEYKAKFPDQAIGLGLYVKEA